MSNIDKKLIQQSEDAEVRYYQSGAVAVDNYDTEVTFEKKQKFQASVVIDQKGNIVATPFGLEGVSRGPRSITLCDTGVAKVTKSPKGTNIRVVIALTKECATERNFRGHFNNLMEELKNKGIDLQEA